MKFRFLISAVGIAAIGLLTNCGSKNSSSSSGTGVLYVVKQVKPTDPKYGISTYSISLSNGALTAFGTTVATGNAPSAMILTPAGDAAFVANSADDTISAYKVGTDSTLTAAGSTHCPTRPVALATNASGKFLFVANQMSDTVSVFTIGQGATLTEVAGSPYTTVPASVPLPAGPVAVATLGNFLYVANQSSNTVAVFQFDSTSGALTPLSPYFVGTAPAGLLSVTLPVGTATPQSQFLYVTNSGSNNISAFTVCAIQSQTCAPTGTPDGKLTPITGSPFSTGTKPGFMATNSTGEFLYTVDTGANQISGFRIAPATGTLTTANAGTMNTGSNPVWAAIRFGSTTTATGISTTTDFIYVANSGGSSVSGYSLNTTTGQLSLIANTPLIVGDQPTAVAVK